MAIDSCRLRRARLLAGEDPHNPGQLDTHPLVREYFGEQFRSQRTEAWQECNQRLFYHYRALAPELPDSFKEIEPLFLAVICACNASLFREALHEVYIPRIQRGNAGFAANVLGVRGTLLSVLIHFFENGRWRSPFKPGKGTKSHRRRSPLHLHAGGAYLTVTRGVGAPEARICYERAESLCHSLNRPLLLYVVLMGLWRHSFVADKLSAAMPLAKRVYSLAEEQNDSALMIGACSALGITHYYLGDFETARQYTTRGVQIWRSGGVRFRFKTSMRNLSVACARGTTRVACRRDSLVPRNHDRGQLVGEELNDMHGSAVALAYAARLAHYEHGAAEMERLALELIELSTHYGFVLWLAFGKIFWGRARSASESTAEGLSWIEKGIDEVQATRTISWISYCLALKAEALHLADRDSESLQAIAEAEGFVEKTGGRYISAELHRLRGIFLAAVGADDTQIEASFRAAISTAKQRKSLSLEERAEATYAEYCRQKASAAPGHRLRIPLR